MKGGKIQVRLFSLNAQLPTAQSGKVPPRADYSHNAEAA